MWSEVAAVYPLLYHRIRFFRTGMFRNLKTSMIRKLLLTHIYQRFETGCQYDGRLRSLFLMPTLELANRRLLARFDDTLRQRYDHQDTFKL